MRMDVKIRSGHEFQADDQLLELRVPGITASNEILGLLVRGAEAQALLGRVAELLQSFLADASDHLSKLAGKRVTLSFSSLADPKRRALVFEAGDQWLQSHIPDLVVMVQESIVPLLGDRAVLVAVPAIDFEENRARLAGDEEWVAKWGDPEDLKELPGQDHIPPTLRGFYSPSLRRWACARVGVDHAFAIAWNALVMMLGGGLGKRSGAPSLEAGAPVESPPTEVQPMPTPMDPPTPPLETSPQP